ncbi:hypothetical protein PGKDCPLP_04371 [Stenotrophomonas maltophilia]|nr:hypothetical protein PGKDCPLP_04371 [Stenotrophomonas maltophilia]
MTKTRAYLTVDGTLSVTAAWIAKRRNENNGAPTGDRFFSTHRLGHRRPVKHVMKGGSSFFAYMDGLKGGQAAGGESLQHLLFKEALGKLAHVRLKLSVPSEQGLRRWRECRIEITRVETEWQVPGEGGYRADLYIEFSSEDALAIKWEGRFLLEVKRSHAVDAAKQEGCRRLGLPVVEVDIDSMDMFRYATPEEQTTDHEEEKYRNRIKRMLEGDSGFLQAVVLSNPSSKPFLEAQVLELKSDIARLQGRTADLRLQVEGGHKRCVDLENLQTRVLAREKLLDGELADSHRTIEVQRKENGALGKENATLRETVRRQSAQLVSEQRTRRRFEYALYVVLVLAAMWVGVRVGSWLTG